MKLKMQVVVADVLKKCVVPRCASLENKIEEKARKEIRHLIPNGKTVVG